MTRLDPRIPDLIHRAAFLLREAIGLTVTQHFKDEVSGNVEIHVFDTDVIKCYCAPWDVGPLAGRGRQGYGQILPRSTTSQFSLGKRSKDTCDDVKQEDERATKIAEMLANEAIRRATASDMPLLQLPGHYEETDSVYKQVARDAGYEKSKYKSAITHQDRYVLARQLASLQHLLTSPDSSAPASDAGPDGTKAVIVKLVEKISSRWTNVGASGLSRVKRQVLNYERLNSKHGPITSLGELNRDNSRAIARSFGGRGKFDAFLSAIAVLDRTNRTSQEANAFKVLIDYWTHHLAQAKSAYNLTNQILDAEALAHLSLINKRLESSGIRIVLITGDRKLVETAYRNLNGIQHFVRAAFDNNSIRSSGYDDSLDDYDGLMEFFGLESGGSIREDDRGEDWILRALDGRRARSAKWHNNQARYFSMNYVRHIWAYTEDVLFDPTENLRARESALEGMREFFSGLLATYATWNNLTRRTLEAIIWNHGSSRLRRAEGVTLADALQRFVILTKGSIERFDLDVNKENELLKDKILKIVERYTKIEKYDWPAMITEIDHWHADTQDRTILPLSHIGALVLMDQKWSSRRNPPDLMFHGLKNTSRALSMLSRKGNQGDHLDPSQFIDIYKSVSRDCLDSAGRPDERAEAYLKFLILAAAFAGANKWHVALGHARRAITIVDRASLRQQRIEIEVTGETNRQRIPLTGREAHFMAAICTRILADGKDSYADAGKHLQNADSARQRESLVESLDELVLLRFANERLALALSRYYHGRKHAEEFLSATRDRYCNAEFKETEKAFETLVEVCLRNLSGDKVFSDDARFRPNVRRSTVSVVASNIIQVAAILSFRRYNALVSDGSPVKRVHLSWALYRMYENRDDPDGPFETKLMRFYRTIGAMLADFPDPNLPSTVDDVERLFQDVSGAMIMTYDVWRYEKLRQFALRVIEEEIRFPLDDEEVF